MSPQNVFDLDVPKDFFKVRTPNQLQVAMILLCSKLVSEFLGEFAFRT